MNIMLEMEKRTRKILFFTFFFIFILLSPLLILYIQGYRFDFENKKLTQTGGLFLKVIPRQAQIYIEEELVKETDFFFGSALIENLLPKRNNIKVKKEGYFDWEKNLEIREKKVTEAKNIVLFPKETNFTLLFKGIKDSWFSEDGKKMIFKEKDEDFWELKLYDLEQNVKSHLLKESDISKKGADIFDLEFSKDGKEIYFDTILKEKEVSFALEINREPPFLKEIERYSFLPEDVITHQQLNGEIYYLDNLGFFYKTDSSFSTKEKVTKAPFLLKQETEYKLSVFSDFIFLIEEGKTLYLLNQETKLFEVLFEGIKDLKISPDRGKIAYFSNCEIRILFLKNTPGEPKRERGENIFLFRLSDKIKDVFWIMPNHLLFITENNIKITEIDDRDMINTIPLAELSFFTKNYSQSLNDQKSPEVFWSSANEKLYILAEENLWVSSKLTP